LTRALDSILEPERRPVLIGTQFSRRGRRAATCNLRPGVRESAADGPVELVQLCPRQPRQECLSRLAEEVVVSATIILTGMPGRGGGAPGSRQRCIMTRPPGVRAVPSRVPRFSEIGQPGCPRTMHGSLGYPTSRGTPDKYLPSRPSRNRPSPKPLIPPAGGWAYGTKFPTWAIEPVRLGRIGLMAL